MGGRRMVAPRYMKALSKRKEVFECHNLPERLF